MTRMSFDELFDRDEQGRAVPRVRLRIGSMTVGPGGAHLPLTGLLLGDVTLADLVGKSLEVEIEDGVHVITGYY